MTKPGHRLKWFFTLHMHSNTMSVFSTSQYSPDQGYETEREAVEEGLAFLRKQIDKNNTEMMTAVRAMNELSREHQKLSAQLDQIRKAS